MSSDMARKDEADGAPTSMVEPFTRPDGYVQVPDPWTRVTGTGDRGRPERQRRERRPGPLRTRFDGASFDTVDCAGGFACWASGERGRVAKLVRG
jgi:hypothetical protein